MARKTADSPGSHGELFGIPYDFRRPSLRRLIGAHWQPGKGMLVPTPFGIGYTLNLASWRSWIVVAVTALLSWSEGRDDAAADGQEIVIEEAEEQ